MGDRGLTKMPAAPTDADAFSALMRTSLPWFTRRVFRHLNPETEYLHNWHIDLIGEYLEAVINGEIRRLNINMPPRYMKSIICNVALSAWVMGHRPSIQVLAASYADELALKFNTETRDVIQSEWFRRAFPTLQMATDQNEKGYFRTTLNGHRKATSVGTSRIGFGGNLLIVDDPLNPKKAMSQVERDSANNWFNQSFYTRMNNKKKDAIIVVMQRLHENDLSGQLIKDGGWENLNIQAIADTHQIISYGKVTVERQAGDILHPDREGTVELEEAKVRLGTQGFSAQYQQKPTPADGEIFSLAWFRRYRETPEFIRVVQSWDTAYKPDQINDPSVCTTWGEAINGYYLLDVWRSRVAYPELKRRFMALAAKWLPSAILVEDKASGQSIIQEFKNDTTLPVIAIEPEGDKLTRASVCSPKVEAGRLWLPDRAPWLHDFEQEMIQFPNGDNDDQVDSVSQFLNWASTKKGTVRVGVLG